MIKMSSLWQAEKTVSVHSNIQSEWIMGLKAFLLEFMK